MIDCDDIIIYLLDVLVNTNAKSITDYIEHELVKLYVKSLDELVLKVMREIT